MTFDIHNYKNTLSYTSVSLQNALIAMQTDSQNDMSINRLAEQIYNRRKFDCNQMPGKILFTGIGKNETIAMKTANMFRSLQYDAHKICPVNAMHGDMGMLDDNDIIVAISKSGNTSELINFLRYVRMTKPSVLIFGVQIGNDYSKFTENCHDVINLPYISEAGTLEAPTNSGILVQIFFDTIAVSLPEISIDEFKQSHPGGTIGGVD